MEMSRDTPSLEPSTVDGRKYYTVWQFARITKKSDSAIYFLIYHGNKMRKLKCERLLGRPLIPIEELVEFPFTLPGRSEEVYYYDKDGGQIDSPPKEADGEY